MPTQETIVLIEKLFLNLLQESLSEDGSDLIQKVEHTVQQYVAEHKATRVLNSVFNECEESEVIFSKGVESALDHVVFMLKRET